jgi:beta-lactamase class A
MCTIMNARMNPGTNAGGGSYVPEAARPPFQRIPQDAEARQSATLPAGLDKIRQRKGEQYILNSGKNLISRRSAVFSGFLAAISGMAFTNSILFGEEPESLSAHLAAIEKKSGGRLGCAVLDTSTGKQILHRTDERFPMCSTFKLIVTALVLHRVEQGQEQLDRRVVYKKEDLVAHSPGTGKHADEKGMTISELCEAAMTLSDNTAANLLLASFGGPQALTAFLRSIGDGVTRLDRNETSLNEATPGDARDTTSPAAMLGNLHRLVLGDILKPASRATLANWMVGCRTGGNRLRAGLPADWKVGDKTGAGENGTTNDIAVFWLPDRAPVFVTAYLTGSTLGDDGRNAILADIGRAIATTLKQG